MNARQAEYVKVLIDNPEASKSQAMAQAGYASSTTSSNLERSGGVTNALVEAMRRKGLTEDQLADKALAMMDSTLHQHYTFKGRVVDEREVPDNPVRQKALEFVAQLYGYGKRNNFETVNLGIIKVPSDAPSTEWNSGNVRDAEIVTETPSESHNGATIPKPQTHLPSKDKA